MNGVLGMTELALMEDIPPEAREYLQFVRQSGEALLAIINDILDLSKIEAGRVVLERGAFMLRAGLAAMFEIHALTARRKGLTLRHAIGEDVPEFLVGDQGRLRQILTNLIGNAIKFTERGEVRVSVELDGQPAAPGAAGLLFRVEDDGLGIPGDRIDEVFDAFTQLGLPGHATFGGTGLGLAISKELVELMGGRIWADSTPGKGSTFSFGVEFGLAEEGDDLEPLPAQPRPSGQAGGLRVLVVEDDRVNRLLVDTYLRKRGHAVATAENGYEALEALAAEPFDLVLMDVRMPDLDGEEAVRAIRRGEAGPDRADVPVVAMTAHALKGDRERLLDAGMDDYLPKPIDMRAVDRVLGQVSGWRGSGPR
jgi:two-component system CheB/CheR fusion protein